MIKLLTKLDYLLRETLLGIQRGGWMNWAAISTVTVLLFLFGISLQTSWQLNSLLNQVGNQMEISVYLQPSTKGEQVLPLIEKFPEVKTVTLVSKEQAWSTLLTQMGISDLKNATEQLEGNPLVDELKVSVIYTEKLPEVAQKLGQLTGVDEVHYLPEILQRLQNLRQGLNWISSTLTGLLLLTAIAVITTTLRLIAISRQQEIEIMQLVGATKTWIYLPFVLQGMSFGLGGGVIAWVAITGIRYSLRGFLLQKPDFIQFVTTSLQLSFEQELLLPGMILGLGVSVGFVASLFALRNLAWR